MKSLIATLVLISSVSAFAACQEETMIKYMHQGYAWDVAAQKAHADCSQPDSVNQEYYKLFNQYLSQGYRWDVAAQMAYDQTHTAPNGDEFVQLVIKYMNQGYSREVAVQKAYQELNS